MTTAESKRASHFAAIRKRDSRPMELLKRRISRKSNQRSALTLLELMVVLVILAIVATVALQSLGPRVETERLNAASRLVEEIKGAVIGPVQKYQIDNTPLISGFVSDVGRYPLSQSNSVDQEDSAILAELWDVETDLATQFPFQFREGPEQPVDYSDIRLPCGWRGPYLQLPIGQENIVDPWGRVPLTYEDSGGFCESICIPAIVSSEQNEKLLIADLTDGKVQVTGKVLVDNTENASIKVALLTPAPERSLTSLIAMDDEDEQPDTFLFEDVPVGFRAVVVDADGRRQTKYIQVTHNGNNLFFDFRVQNSQPVEQVESSE